MIIAIFPMTPQVLREPSSLNLHNTLNAVKVMFMPQPVAELGR